MAEIRLNYREAEEGRLPCVCMKCGVEIDDDEEVVKRFAWKPNWITLTILLAIPIYLVLALLMTKRMTIIAPMCQQHRRHWFSRQLITWGGFLAWGTFFIASLVAASTMAQPGNDDHFGIAMLISAGLFLVWALVAIIVTNTSIRPTEITDDDITLTGLSEEFVDAVRDIRRRRRRRRRDYDDEYDDDYDD